MICRKDGDTLRGGKCPTCEARLEKSLAWLETELGVSGIVSVAKSHRDDPKVRALAAKLKAQLHLGDTQALVLADQLLDNEEARAATGPATDEHDVSSVTQKPRPQSRQFADQGDLSGYRPTAKSGVNPARGPTRVAKGLGERRVEAIMATIRKGGAPTEAEELESVTKTAALGVWQTAQTLATAAFPGDEPSVALYKWTQSPEHRDEAVRLYGLVNGLLGRKVTN